MIPVETGWYVDVNWRAWLFGVTFGPEVWEIHLGPIMIKYDTGRWA